MKPKPRFANARAHAHGVTLATRRIARSIRYGQEIAAPRAESSSPRPPAAVQTPAPVTLGSVWDEIVVRKPYKPDADEAERLRIERDYLA